MIQRAALALVAVLWSPGVSAADEGKRTVALALERCAAVPETSVRRIVRVEIGDLLVTNAGRAADRVAATCDGDSVSLEASDGAGTQRLARSLRLDGFPPDARPRAVALAAIELVAALNPEVRRRMESARDSEPPGEAPARMRLLVQGFGRHFFASRGVAVWGGGVAIDRELGGAGVIAADVDVGGARTSASLGAVNGLLASASLAAGLRTGAAAVWSATVGARFGVVRLAGEPAPDPFVTGRRTVRPWGGPVAAVTSSWGRGWGAVRLGVETGFAVVAAEGTANGATAAAVGGPWVAAFVAAGLQKW
jgi:hypothetical protein